MKAKSLFAVILVVAALAVFIWPRPFCAQETEEAVIAPPGLPTALPSWLHVEVETSYSWFHQKSKGRAWVTVSKSDTARMKVGTLCIRLAAHDTTVKCLNDADEIIIEEKKKGVQIRKRTAVVTAWTEEPALDSITVTMEP